MSLVGTPNRRLSGFIIMNGGPSSPNSQRTPVFCFTWHLFCFVFASSRAVNFRHYFLLTLGSDVLWVF